MSMSLDFYVKYLKRICCALLVLTCFSFANKANAQGVYLGSGGGFGFGVFSSPDRFGLKFGVAYSGEEEGFGTNAAINAAFQEEWYLGDWASMVANIGYMEKSFRYDLLASDTQEAKEFNTTLKYFYVDYLIKFRMNCDGWYPNLFVGPRVDIIAGEDSDFEREVGGSTEIENTTMGLTYGFGLERPVGSFVFGVSLSHYYDFSAGYRVRLGAASPVIQEDFKQNAFVLDFMIGYEVF